MHACDTLLHFQDDLFQIRDFPLIVELMETVYLFEVHTLNDLQTSQIPLYQDTRFLAEYEL